MTARWTEETLAQSMQWPDAGLVQGGLHLLQQLSHQMLSGPGSARSLNIRHPEAASPHDRIAFGDGGRHETLAKRFEFPLEVAKRPDRNPSDIGFCHE
jgi:hypothetical protein